MVRHGTIGPGDIAMPATDTIPRPDLKPRAFLEYLYNAAVIRALPLHNTAAWLPAPPAPES